MELRNKTLALYAEVRKRAALREKAAAAALAPADGEDVPAGPGDPGDPDDEK